MSELPKPKDNEPNVDSGVAQDDRTRRDFLRSLGRWSAIIIGGATFAGMMAQPDAAGWVNGGGGWVNGRGGGGGAAWVNRAGGGGAGWVNRAGGGSWVNRAGGGGGWVNARGGWVNRI
jgi:hypothetical protein